MITLVVAFGVVGFSGGGDGGDGSDLPLPPASVPPIDLALNPDGTVSAPGSAFEFAQPRRVIDGDTVEVVLHGQRVSVRLFGIDAPERGERCASEASERLASIIDAEDEILLHPGPRNDDGGRLLRYAFTPADQASIDALLIGEGLAEAWRRDGQLRDDLVALERQAQEAHTGCLWSSGG